VKKQSIQDLTPRPLTAQQLRHGRGLFIGGNDRLEIRGIVGVPGCGNSIFVWRCQTYRATVLQEKARG
jgi:hypothetical protein